ncbi:MAG: IS66 family insertion sequence element accessory protein TnpB [Lentisphaeria bacterium]
MLTTNQQIFLYRKPVDLRKSFDALASLVNYQLQENPLSGAFFIFLNKSANRIKILYWDQDGFAIWMKRLERGVFPVPINLNEDKISIDRIAFHALLDGVKIIKKTRRFELKKL